tara:strand:+ start:4748 stop:6736 length:1989 start_codon:yes stop_codon:yes gene_type:complete
MASATLEMILKLTGADKTSRGLDKVSNSARDLDNEVNNTTTSNQRFGKSMSGLQKTAVAGGAIFAGKLLFDFSKEAINAAVSAEEAAAAFETTFGTAADRATKFLENFANKAGLTVGEAQQLQATLGAVAQGIGFTQEESADLSISLTKIAADVASFSNISAGAEPVLNAFRSALVGEREALKTYGIAIVEAEVQTKAFEQTGKTSADALTRQEKALATLTLIQEKAGVQIGDLDRTLDSFANQSRAAGAELRELKEEIGDELIPALAEMLPTFREFIDNVGPSIVDAFGTIANGVTTLFLALDRIADTDGNLIDLIFNMSELAQEQREFNEAVKASMPLTTERIVTEALLNHEKRKSRNETNLQRTAFEKFDTQLQKKSIPQLKTYLELISVLTGEDEDLTTAEDDLTDARDRVTEAQRKEALATAEETLQKKQLQAQIQELLFFQNKGVNVSEELAVATEKLRLVEFELTRESEELRDAKKELTDIEDQLKPKIDAVTDSFEEQVDQYIKLNEQNELFKELAADKEFMKILSANQKLNPFIAANLDVLSGIAEIQGLDERAREFNNFARAAERLADAQARLRDIPTIEFTPPDPTPDPGDIPLDPALQKLLDELQSGNGNQNGNGNGEEEVKVKIELDENASEFFTATREKALQQGFDLQ